MNETNHNSNPGYEKKDVSTTQIILWAVGIIALIAFFLIGLNEWFVHVTEEVVQDQVLAVNKPVIGELHAFEDSVLTSYGWSDSTQTAYRIPLDSAIRIVAEEAKGSR